MELGKLIVLTGPSGVGKGTLLRAIMGKYPELELSISATTRQPRDGEVDGKDYYFVSRDKFEAMIAAGELLEWAEYAGNYYGTPRLPVESKIQLGKSVILEIELVGAREVNKNFPNAWRIFVLPPSLAELETRIRGRGQDSEIAIARRLERAKIEIEAAHEFDVQIINDDFDAAVLSLEAAIFGK
ncbi:MAG TPA: guanylate kinase [Cyanobacteria bacterium UBA11149]|nr:guanylate kinase [Cyanobacteria bacterium UBA11367]HBE60869.1 guanylate kinase [Cyanobacteria bacterium UBA11366]HBR73748.1 guanylate kinase [Cyanobacteria bacterium UBA11159]HBS70970.1 guanylate kinase [Cyanobacteria bacterium UBA11153]HBW92169.1 guanylate kinase [Cyanobacteria bacterium UBA11149]